MLFIFDDRFHILFEPIPVGKTCKGIMHGKILKHSFGFMLFGFVLYHHHTADNLVIVVMKRKNLRINPVVQPF